MKTIQIEEFTCFVGQNAKENWCLLDRSNSKDIFFHLSSFPSCYVILRTNNNVDGNIIKRCAEICKENTKYRAMRGIYVDYTTVSNIEKGNVVGEIIYKSLRKVQKVKI